MPGDDTIRIISLKIGYGTDHSSTNYMFFTSENKVPAKIKNFLKTTKYGFRIRRNTISFTVPGEGYLPDELEKSLLAHYRIPMMIYEDYDWWNVLLVFDFNENLFKLLGTYNDVGVDHTIRVEKIDAKIVLQIVAHMDYQSLHEIDDSNVFLALEKIFSQVSDNIIKGHLDELDLIKMYCGDINKFHSQKPKTMVGEILLKILEGT